VGDAPLSHVLHHLSRGVLLLNGIRYTASSKGYEVNNSRVAKIQQIRRLKIHGEGEQSRRGGAEEKAAAVDLMGT